METGWNDSLFEHHNTFDESRKSSGTFEVANLGVIGQRFHSTVSTVLTFVLTDPMIISSPARRSLPKVRSGEFGVRIIQSNVSFEESKIKENLRIAPNSNGSPADVPVPCSPLTASSTLYMENVREPQNNLSD